eukprot:TRINITY_DN9850_c0_g2_i3.p1 TRINITY_DN9850_c0_g2~~TRINITY_DN9850_c0_g2_i3.p1  ORF type:complete len:583 (-),score=118.22 TRINITY_DN9850_c0_g2_i3:155-1903(-)
MDPTVAAAAAATDPVQDEQGRINHTMQSVASFELLTNYQFKWLFGVLLSALALTFVFMTIFIGEVNMDFNDGHPPTSHAGCTATWLLPIESYFNFYTFGSFRPTGYELIVILYKNGEQIDTSHQPSSSGRLFWISPLSDSNYTMTVTSPSFCVASDVPDLEIQILSEEAGMGFVAANVAIVVMLLVVLMLGLSRVWKLRHTELPELSVTFYVVPFLKILSTIASFFYLPVSYLLEELTVVSLIFILMEAWRFMIARAAIRCQESLKPSQLGFSQWLQDGGCPKFQARAGFVATLLALWTDRIFWAVSVLVHVNDGPLGLAEWDEFSSTPDWLGYFLIALKTAVILLFFFLLDRMLKRVLYTAPYSLVHRQVNLRRFCVLLSGICLFGIAVLNLATIEITRDDLLVHWDREVVEVLAVFPGRGHIVSNLWITLWIVCMSAALVPKAKQVEACEDTEQEDQALGAGPRPSVLMESDFIAPSATHLGGHNDVANIDVVRMQCSMSDWAYRGAPPLHPPEGPDLKIGDCLYPTYPEWEEDLTVLLSQVKLHAEIDDTRDTHVKVFVEDLPDSNVRKIVHILSLIHI